MSGDHRTVIKGILFLLFCLLKDNILFLVFLILGSPSQYVKLNVGGSLHYTTIGTLTKHDSKIFFN